MKYYVGAPVGIEPQEQIRIIVRPVLETDLDRAVVIEADSPEDAVKKYIELLRFLDNPRTPM